MSRDFRLGCDVSEGGVVQDLFDHLGGIFGLDGSLAREIERGDLETVEEKAGAARVDAAAGDAAENLADGMLDSATVLKNGEIEGGVAVADLIPVFEAVLRFGL
ncbi:hypothetical protein [Granulicella sibirica]|uniref:hypothetical protein n=1 Tax=Granulicella sibirica TaxID=2479048 RepID=UPI001008B4E9|nr:hypothetical protein [Granulicella sibirica]